MFYEAKIKVEKTLDSGEVKEVNEHFIMDAELFAEAEKIMFEEYPNHKLDVYAIFRSKVREIINEKEDDKPFFKAIVKYEVLVCADSVAEATAITTEYLKQGYDLRLDEVKRVKIVDYIRYKPA